MDKLELPLLKTTNWELHNNTLGCAFMLLISKLVFQSHLRKKPQQTSTKPPTVIGQFPTSLRAIHMKIAWDIFTRRNTKMKLRRVFKTSCSKSSTSLTLDFPSASLKSSTYVTSPTTWDIQRGNTKENNAFKITSLLFSQPWHTATGGEAPLEKSTNDSIQTNIPLHTTMPYCSITETPISQGQRKI